MLRKPRASSPKEDRLVEAARRGDSRAFEDLVTAYDDRLRSFIRSKYPALVACGVDGDVIQESWLKAHKRMLKNYVGRGKFDDTKGSFNNWILAIVNNACIDTLRKILRGAPPEDEGSSEQKPLDSGIVFVRPVVSEDEDPSRAGAVWWDGLAADTVAAEEKRERKIKAGAVAKQVRQKGLKETKLAALLVAPNWRNVVIDTLSPMYPHDSRRLFETRRILNDRGCERGLREWALAAGNGKHRVTWEKLTLMIDVCVESAIRSRLPRKDPDRWSPVGLACALSVSFLCGQFRFRGPHCAACTAFLNATFPRGKRWTATRLRQTVSRHGWTLKGIFQRASEAGVVVPEKKSRPR